jgi:hypothetical protein
MDATQLSQASSASSASPRYPARRVSPLRVGIALLLGTILLFGVNLGLAGRQRETPEELLDIQRKEKEEAIRPAILNLIREGQQRLSSGDPAAAVQSFRAAEQLAPKIDGLRRMRLAAEQKSAEMAQMSDREREIAGHLLAAQEAVKTLRYPDATLSVLAVLQLDPQHPEATAMMKQIGEATKRLAQVPLPRAQKPASSRPTAEAPLQEGVPAESAGTPAEAQTATIRVIVTSEMPAGGSVRILLNDKVIMNEGVGPALKGNVFRRKKSTISFAKNLEVPEGSARLVVHVTPKNKTAIPSTFNEFFLGGSRRELTIHASATNSADVDLQQ